GLLLPPVQRLRRREHVLGGLHALTEPHPQYGGVGLDGPTPFFIFRPHLRVAHRTSPMRTAFRLVLGMWMVGAMGCGASERKGSVRATEEMASRFRNVEGGVGFVGDEACASCHEDLYASYQHHGMARSLYRLEPERVVEDFSGVAVTHPASGSTYTAYERDGRYWQEEYRLDAQGRKTHRLVREMKYVVGSGTAARTYLTEENGRYYELPLTWYTQAE